MCVDGEAGAAGEVITPDDVMGLMEDDVKASDLILWVGISFEQSASTVYFRNVRHWLQEVSGSCAQATFDCHAPQSPQQGLSVCTPMAQVGRGGKDGVLQAVINPSDEAIWNLMTALSNAGESRSLALQQHAPCCIFLPTLRDAVVMVMVI